MVDVKPKCPILIGRKIDEGGLIRFGGFIDVQLEHPVDFSFLDGPHFLNLRGTAYNGLVSRPDR